MSYELNEKILNTSIKDRTKNSYTLFGVKNLIRKTPEIGRQNYTISKSNLFLTRMDIMFIFLGLSHPVAKRLDLGLMGVGVVCVGSTCVLREPQIRRLGVCAKFLCRRPLSASVN